VVRKQIYYTVKALTGSQSPRIYEERLAEFHRGISPNTVDDALARLLKHCADKVPYYRGIFAKLGVRVGSDANPRDFVAMLPILTRDLLSNEFEALKSTDMDMRKGARVNSSGGSTGEPVRLIQDDRYRAEASANTLLYSSLVGKQPAELEVRLWGSERDIFENGIGFKATLQYLITNTRFLNAFRMTPEKMREFLGVIDGSRPALIMAYAQALYELAQYAFENGIQVAPQRAVMTSAGTLHSFMRDKIEQVFACPVYNRYGSREVGDVACQLPANSGTGEGLWVAPWGTYVEIVDDEGHSVPAGTEGNILVTSLANYTMPLIRYKIGDRGILQSENHSGPVGQVLQRVTGRVTDNLRTKDGRVIPGEYFIHLIGVVLNNGKIRKFQVEQLDYSHVMVRIVPLAGPFNTDDLVHKIQLVMGGSECDVEVAFVDSIAESNSGKYRYTICRVNEH